MISHRERSRPFESRSTEGLFDGHCSESQVKSMDGKHAREVTALRDSGYAQTVLRRKSLPDPNAESVGFGRLKGTGNSQFEAHVYEAIVDGTAIPGGEITLLVRVGMEKPSDRSGFLVK